MAVDPLAQAVEQHELFVRIDDGQRQSGQTRTRSHIDEAFTVVRTHHQAVEDMPLTSMASGSRTEVIVSLVPLVQQLDQLPNWVFWVSVITIPGLHEQAVQSCSMLSNGEFLRRFYAAGRVSSGAPADGDGGGVMPEMRDA